MDHGALGLWSRQTEFADFLQKSLALDPLSTFEIRLRNDPDPEIPWRVNIELVSVVPALHQELEEHLWGLGLDPAGSAPMGPTVEKQQQSGPVRGGGVIVGGRGREGNERHDSEAEGVRPVPGRLSAGIWTGRGRAKGREVGHGGQRGEQDVLDEHHGEHGGGLGMSGLALSGHGTDHCTAGHAQDEKKAQYTFSHDSSSRKRPRSTCDRDVEAAASPKRIKVENEEDTASKTPFITETSVELEVARFLCDLEADRKTEVKSES